MRQFDRQYRLSAGAAGGVGFEIGETTVESPIPLHISFTVEKADTETPNTARISLWNLSPEHLAILNRTDCTVALRAGYDKHMTLVFVGTVTYIATEMDEGDRETEIELTDGRVALRDTYVSLSYAGKISTRKIIEDIAGQMGVAVTFSYNAAFYDFPNGFSFIGAGRAVLDKACASGNLQWQIYNGVLQIKRKGDTMTREVYLLSPDSGLVGIPKKVSLGNDGVGSQDQSGWEVAYLLNGAIGIGDYVRLESKVVKGYFRIQAIEMQGDNLEGDWLCRAMLLEA